MGYNQRGSISLISEHHTLAAVFHRYVRQSDGWLVVTMTSRVAMYCYFWRLVLCGGRVTPAAAQLFRANKILVVQVCSITCITKVDSGKQHSQDAEVVWAQSSWKLLREVHEYLGWSGDMPSLELLRSLLSWQDAIVHGQTGLKLVEQHSEFDLGYEQQKCQERGYWSQS